MEDFKIVFTETINGHRVEYITDGIRYGWRSGRKGSKLIYNSVAEAQANSGIIFQMPYRHAGKGRWVANIPIYL